MSRAAQIDAAIADCDMRLDKLLYARMLDDCGERFVLDMATGTVEKLAPPSLNEAYKFVCHSHLVAKCAQAVLAELKERFPVQHWQIGGGCYGAVATDCIRLFGVAASSNQGVSTLLALWRVNAMRALSNLRQKPDA